jgi:hypothetical protein
MRPYLALAPLALLLALPPARQDPPAQDETPKPGLTTFLERERVRIEKEIEGTWLLMTYQPPTALFNPENIRGVAMFRDGYLSVNIMAQTFVPEFLGDGVQLFVQGGAHRYRISEFAELQTAAIVAFQNLADEDELVVEPSDLPREYKVAIDPDGGTLSLTSSYGSRLTWSRLKPTAFPSESLDALNAVRGR